MRHLGDLSGVQSDGLGQALPLQGEEGSPAQTLSPISTLGEVFSSKFHVDHTHARTHTAYLELHSPDQDGNCIHFTPCGGPTRNHNACILPAA